MPNGDKEIRIYATPRHDEGKNGKFKTASAPKIIAGSGKRPKLVDPRRSSKTATGAAAPSFAAPKVPIPADGWHNTQGAVDTYYAPTGDASPVMSLSDSEYSIGQSLQGAAPVAGDVNGLVVTYPGVRPSVDLEFRQGTRFVKGSVILHQVPGAGGESFTFDLLLAAGLTPAATDDGGIEVVDANGDRQFAIPAPTMWDSSLDPGSDEPAYGPVSLVLGGDATSGWTMTLTADRQWLDAPERVYPVTLDPTFTSATDRMVLDTTVNSLFPNNQYNVDFEPNPATPYYRNKIGDYTGTGDNHSLLYFDLSTIVGLPVSLAKLNLRFYHTSFSTNAKYKIQQIGSCNWQPGTATWNNQPAVTGSAITSSSVVENAWNVTTITSWVQAYQAGTAQNCGFQLSGAPAAGTGPGFENYLKFVSMEDPTSGGAYQPYITVTVAGNSLVSLGDDPYSSNSGGVNTGSGNYSQTFSDLEIAASGPALRVDRTYNSLDARIGLFGLGMSSPYDMTTSADLYYRSFLLGDGRRERYVRQPDGSYEPPSGASYVISEAAAFNAVYLKDKSQTEWLFFMNTGKIGRVTDAHGHYLNFTYDASARLTKVQLFLNRSGGTNAGPSLTFGYTGTSALVTSVTATGGTQVQYSYNTTKTMKFSCDPSHPITVAGTGCTGYTYDTRNRLTLVTQPEGNYAVQLSYDANGLVFHRRDGANRLWTYTWGTRASTPNCPGTIDTTVTAPDLTTQRSIYRTSDGHLMCHIDELGRITQVGYDGKGFKYFTINPAGDVHAWGRDPRGNVIVDVDESGITKYMAYDSLDRLTYTCDDRCTSATTAAYAWHYTYVGATNDIATKSTPGLTQTYNYTEGTETSTDGAGTFTPIGLPEVDVDPRVGIGNIRSYFYDSIGRLHHSTDAAGLVTSFTYDTLGRTLSTSTQYKDSAGVAKTSSTTTTYWPHLADTTLNWFSTEVTGPAIANTVTAGTHQSFTTTAKDNNGRTKSVTVKDLAVTGADPTRVTYSYYNLADQEWCQRDTTAQATVVRWFDGNGRVSKVADANQVDGVCATGAAPPAQYTMTTYTATGQPDTVTLNGYVKDPIGAPTVKSDIVLHNYAYDVLGRKIADTEPASVYDNSSHGTSSRVTEYEYARNGLPTRTLVHSSYAPFAAVYTVVTNEKSYTNGFLTREYGGEVISTDTTKAHGPISRTDYDYDNAGRQTVTKAWMNSTDYRQTVLTLDDANNTTKQVVTEHHINATDRVRSTSMSYDAMSRMSSTQVDGLTTPLTKTTNQRDERGLILRTYDLRGITAATVSDYDALGRVTTTKSPSTTIEAVGGGTQTAATPTVTVQYNTFGEATHTKDPNGNVTVTSYDNLGRKTQIAQPHYNPIDGSAGIDATEIYTYDKNGNLKTQTDRYGKVTTFDYNGRNAVVRTTLPLRQGETVARTRRVAYHDDGKVSSTTDEALATVSTWYEVVSGQPATIQQSVKPSAAAAAVTRKTTFEYDSFGRKTLETSPEGENATWTYDWTGNLRVHTNPDTTDDRYGYWFGQATDYRNPTDRLTYTTYDDAGRVTEIENKSANGGATYGKTLTSYDLGGNVQTVTTPRGGHTTYAYDNANRLQTVTQETIAPNADTIQVQAFYDAAGNMTRFRDGEGVRLANASRDTLLTYTPWNQVEKRTVPSTPGQTTLVDREFKTSYDQAGQVSKFQQPAGVTVTRSYDTGLLITEAATQNATTAQRSFTYDAVGRMETVNAQTGAANETFIYNEAGQVITATGPNAATSNYTYDRDGRVTSRADQSGTTNYLYNGYFGGLTGHLDGVQDSLTGNWRAYGYNTANGEQTAVDYCASTDWITCLGTAVKSHRDLTYDAVSGKPATDILKNPAGTTIASTAYTYDNDSNIQTKTVGPAGFAGAAVNTYTYDLAERLSSWQVDTNPAKTITYDDANNRTSLGTVTYNYDARNRITNATNGTSYTWDARGALQSSTKNSVTTNATYDPLGRMTQQAGINYTYDGLDRVTTRNAAPFTYAGTANDPVTDGTYTYSRGLTGNALTSKPTAGTARNILNDAHGDVIANFDANGTINGSSAYNPYGEITNQQGTNPTIGYQGSWTDPTTADIWMAARWYRPATATFLSEDTINGPLTTPVALNRYTYANGNPMNYWDPTGHSGEPNAAAAADVAIATAYCMGGQQQYCERAGIILQHEDDTHPSYDQHGTITRRHQQAPRPSPARPAPAPAAPAGDVGDFVSGLGQGGLSQLSDFKDLAKLGLDTLGNVVECGATTVASVFTLGFVDSDCSDLKDEVVGLAKGLINTGKELWGALSHAFTTGDFGTLLNTLAKSTLHIDVQGCISEKDATIAGCIGEATGKIAVQLVAGAGVGKALDKFKDFISSTSTAVDVATDGSVAAMDSFTESGATISHSSTATAIGDDANTLTNFGRSRGAAGHDVIVHGDEAGNFRVNGDITNPNQIAEAIRGNPNYGGGPINLVTCHGACGAAQELQEIMGVPVNASPYRVDLDPWSGVMREFR